ncbi:Cytochrome C oxidase, cbb3-type, subunit III [Persephonella hydrogeniphila]|uniref:Cytochrome C oxidase, cbb3-type, subunit III n=1 Tax=Persephonella hydrogeniphila TaxID=198703 RepID=A0A285N0K4_9AQUI|nr:cytochrome c [Persephonella hydrogeniphila]SNZ02868.1 Cytochrome C oxidase, cbb3-type, subunit III [Persephonella hydrogeniphila]
MSRVAIVFFLLVFNAFAQEYGYQIYRQYCASCHAEKLETGSDQSTIKAPPIDALTRQIKYFYRTKDKFTEYLVDYISDPSPEKSVCKPCIERWGVMPPVKDLTEEEKQSVALWMYKNFR